MNMDFSETNLLAYNTFNSIGKCTMRRAHSRIALHNSHCIVHSAQCECASSSRIHRIATFSISLGSAPLIPFNVHWISAFNYRYFSMSMRKHRKVRRYRWNMHMLETTKHISKNVNSHCVSRFPFSFYLFFLCCCHFEAPRTISLVALSVTWTLSQFFSHIPPEAYFSQLVVLCTRFSFFLSHPITLSHPSIACSFTSNGVSICDFAFGHFTFE